MQIAIAYANFPTQNIQVSGFIVYRKIMILSNGKNLGKTCAIFWSNLGQFMAQKMPMEKSMGFEREYKNIYQVDIL